ncbi:uncharacterized protein LOC106013254, partial [Aplysia californica]|uniref:Uncharacterized protein LOC106013254 n=1 Tax=Aplysia californica TaxID=6500 RepID=A0ABM1AAC6_APLCA
MDSGSNGVREGSHDALGDSRVEVPLRWYDRPPKMQRLEDSSALDTPSEESIHYLNLASGYHHAPPFAGNAPLTSNDISIKQEYHVSPTRANGEPHNSTGAAYPMAMLKTSPHPRHDTSTPTPTASPHAGSNNGGTTIITINNNNN